MENCCHFVLYNNIDSFRCPFQSASQKIVKSKKQANKLPKHHINFRSIKMIINYGSQPVSVWEIAQ